MSKTSFFSLLSVAAISLGLSIPAGAAPVLTITSGMFSTQAGATSTSFDGGTLPAGFTASGPNAGVVSGSLQYVYADPTGDATPYAYAGPGSSVTYTFASPANYFGLYWGSPDAYNLLTFTDVNNVTTTYDLPGAYLNNQTAVYANLFDTGANWKSVTFTSTTAAFEFDNVATALLATPEPTSIALLAGGLLAIGFGALRRRKS